MGRGARKKKKKKLRKKRLGMSIDTDATLPTWQEITGQPDVKKKDRKFFSSVRN